MDLLGRRSGPGPGMAVGHSARQLAQMESAIDGLYATAPEPLPFALSLLARRLDAILKRVRHGEDQ